MEPMQLPDGGLATDRFVLRPPVEADRAQVMAILADSEIPRWTRVPQPYLDEHFDQFVQIAADGAAAGTDLPLLVHDREDDRVLAAVGIHAVDVRDLVAEFGYWCAAPARGQGVVTEALTGMLAWVRGTQAWERLEIHVAVGNDASARVAKKAGFHLDAVVPNRLRLRDGRADMQVWGWDRPLP